MGISYFARATLGGAMLALMAGMASADTVTLRYSNWLPVTHIVHAGIVQPWIDNVERVTEGRVKVEITPKVVGSVAGQFDVVADGQADLALIVPGYTPGRFPLIEGFEMPFLGDDATVRSPATWRIYEKHLAQGNGFEGVHVLSLFTGNAAQVFTTGKDITTIEDFKGLKLRSPQPATTKAIELLGAVPVVKPVPEIYELAAGGVIDGGVIPPDTITAFKLQTVLKHMTWMPGGLANTVLLWGVNPDKWESISEADREAIAKVSGEAMAAMAGTAHQSAVEAALKQLEADGEVITRPDAAVVDQVKASLASVESDWVAAAKSAGLADPQAMLDDLRAEIAK